MSIENYWNKIHGQQDDDLSSLLQQPDLSKLSSHNPMIKIKKNLRINMAWGTIICLCYVAIIIYFHIWQVQLAIGTVLLFSLWAVLSAWQVYKKINSPVSAAPLLAELKRHYQAINRWMFVQERVGLIIYPVSAAGGFMLGGVLNSGKTLEAFMSKPTVLISMVIVIILLVPVAFYAARWLCRHSFGKHMKALKQNIDQLENGN